MRKQLDYFDITILEALGVYGPRNIAMIARKLGEPVQTVRDRIERLKSHFSLYFKVNIYHTNIGLKKAFVFAKAKPSCKNLLLECLKAEGYWLYLAACYNKPESYYGIYGIPVDHTLEFEQFLREIEKLNVAENIDLYWSTSIHTVNLTRKWFDYKSDTWVFRWDAWIREIQSQRTQLPYTLVEQENYPQKADGIDILILKELEKDATKKLRDLAKTLNLSPKKMQYHYAKHVIGKGLIEGFGVYLGYLYRASDIFCLRFDFHTEKDMAKFAVSLKDKPFVLGIGKIFGENGLLVQIYLPRKEFSGFTDSLSKLIRKGLLKSYDYVIEDQSRKQGQTISYEFFKDKSWIYDHKEHMKKLQELAKHRT